MERMLITDEDKWLEKRKGYVTSTEAAALFGLSTRRTAFELWHIKRGLIEEPRLESDFMAFGKFVEEPVCKMINYKHPDWKISPFPFFIYDDNEKIGSSYDREILIPGYKKPWLLEIKSISYEQYKKEFIEHDAEDIEASPQYEVQMQVELHCAGSEYEGCLMAVFILDTRQLKLIFRKPEPEMQRVIVAEVKNFWAMPIAPPPDYARDKSLLAKLLPSCDPELTMDATKNNRVTELTAQYKSSKELEKQEKENADKCYGELLTLLGRAKFAWTNLHKITISDVKESKTLVTAEMVGTFINVRGAYKRLTITPIEKKKEKAA